MPDDKKGSPMGGLSSVRFLASLPVAERRHYLNSICGGQEPEEEYDRDWVDLDEDYDD